jgi:hypothetical protein
MIAVELMIGAIGVAGSVTSALIKTFKVRKSANLPDASYPSNEVVLTVKRGNAVEFQRVLSQDEAVKVLAVAHEGDNSAWTQIPERAK